MLRLSSVLALLMTVLFGYQNCGSDFISLNSGTLDSASISAAQCDSVLQSAFVQGFQPFLSTTCNACHISGGVGKGAFASDDVSIAFNAFVLDTPSEVEARAVDASHAAGITGPANQDAISSAKAIWDAAAASCSTTTAAAAPTYVTIDKKINGSTSIMTLSWALDSELTGSATGQNYGGAIFSIGVQEVTNVSGDTLYYFTTPTIKTGTVPLSIGDITIRLNGTDQTLMTTYSQLSFNVPANGSQVMCTTTGTDPFSFAATDTVGIRFGLLKAN